MAVFSICRTEEDGHWLILGEQRREQCGLPRSKKGALADPEITPATLKPSAGADLSENTRTRMRTSATTQSSRRSIKRASISNSKCLYAHEPPACQGDATAAIADTGRITAVIVRGAEDY